MSEPPKPRRRWLRFSLGTALIALTGLCVLFGVQANRAEKQRRAVEMVKRFGGSVIYYNEQHLAGPVTGKNDFLASLTPRWLRRLAGEDYFSTVGIVYLDSDANGEWHPLAKKSEVDLSLLSDLTELKELYCRLPFTDDDLSHLSRLAQLERLELDGTHLTDGGTKHLRGLNSLIELNLTGHFSSDSAPLTAITDRGLAELNNLKALKFLLLGKMPVTENGLKQLDELKELEFFKVTCSSPLDADLAWLKHLPKLNWISLHGVHVTKAGWSELAVHKNLENWVWYGDGILQSPGCAGITVPRYASQIMANCKGVGFVSLYGLSISDHTLESLIPITHLRCLEIRGTAITDTGLDHLKPMQELEYIDLSSSQISDAGLCKLVLLPKLSYLTLDKTQITDSGIVHLQKMHLTRVSLKGTQVTEDAAERLRKATQIEVITDAKP